MHITAKSSTPLPVALSALLVIAGISGVVAPKSPDILKDLDVMLASADSSDSIALIMGPTGYPQPNAGFVSTVDQLYLQPLGFDGQAESLFTPELGYGTDTNLPKDVADLMAAIHTQLDTGDVSAADPIWVFGYSQSAAAASEAMYQLHDEGVPSDYLHFVLAGDPASAHGGILNALLPSLPGWLRSWFEEMLPKWDISQTFGLVTPEYYQTDVYTLTGDGYANWPEESIFSNIFKTLTAIFGFFTSHEEYLGLTPEILQGSTIEYTDGPVTYHSIDSSGVPLLSTLWNAATNVNMFGLDLGGNATAATDSFGLGDDFGLGNLLSDIF